jgi:ribosomal-protein-alanine N-acetyltransferase
MDEDDASEVRRTADLLLRPVRAEDVESLVVIETDPRTTRHSPTGPPTREQAEQLLLSVVAAWDEGGPHYWAVEHERQVVGTAGLRRATLHARECWNLYYRLSPDVWGRGFATQAAREAVDCAAALPGELPVVARTRPENSAAQRVAQKVGLERREDLDSNGFYTFASSW